MFKNNVRSTFFMGLWFLVVYHFLFEPRLTRFMAMISPVRLHHYIIAACISVLFSIFVSWFFLEPQGSFLANLRSISSLIILNLAVAFGLAAFYVTKHMDMTGLFILLGALLVEKLIFFLALQGPKRQDPDTDTK